ncbi:hypothetical protein CVT26_004049 [Gymnopilus dilepis]|uniref:Uncharacterized protein n=1 Tax=Gymnopilus dilepis TaxID=231916 RepID=A0A409WKS8_9AGAR|nr:hypothetical protein CVT26_004049 [Gymnopilus dilepis]
MSGLRTPTPSELFTPEKAKRVQRWLSNLSKHSFLDAFSEPSSHSKSQHQTHSTQPKMPRLFGSSKNRALGGYPAYPATAGYHAGYPAGAAYVAGHPTAYGASAVPGAIPAMATAAPVQVAAPAVVTHPPVVATAANPLLSPYGAAVGGTTQLPGVVGGAGVPGALGGTAPLATGGLATPFGALQNQGQLGAARGATGAAEEEETKQTTSTGGPGGVQQTTTEQEEEQVSSSNAGPGRMGNGNMNMNAGNPAAGFGNGQYGVGGGYGNTQYPYGAGQGQQMPMPGSMPGPGPMSNPNMPPPPMGGAAYPQYGGAYPPQPAVQPVPVGSTNLNISIPPVTAPTGVPMPGGYRSASPPRSRSHRSRSIPPSPSSSPRAYRSTRDSDRETDRDSPIPLPPDYIPTSGAQAGDRSRGIDTYDDYAPRSSHGHHHHHRHHGSGSSRHRSASQSYAPSPVYPSYPATPSYPPPSSSRPAYSRRRSRSVDDRDMYHSRARERSGGRDYGHGYYSSRADPYQGGAAPAVVPQSGNQPVMVPIDNGRGGWVVVPPKGAGLRVMDPSQTYGDTRTSSRHHSSGTHTHSSSPRTRSNSTHSPGFFSWLFGSGKHSASADAPTSSRAVPVQAQPQPVQYHYVNPPRSKGRSHRRRRDSF